MVPSGRGTKARSSDRVRMSGMPRPLSWRSREGSVAAGSEETCAQVVDSGGSAEVVALDVTDDDSRRHVVADLFDRLDVANES